MMVRFTCIFKDLMKYLLVDDQKNIQLKCKNASQTRMLNERMFCKNRITLWEIVRMTYKLVGMKEMVELTCIMKDLVTSLQVAD